MARLSKVFVQKHRYFDFNGDGRFSEDRIKGKDKQILKKQRRKFEKEQAKNEIDEELEQII